MNLDASGILLSYIVLALVLAVPVWIVAKVVGAQKDTFSNCFIAVVLSLAAQMIALVVAPNLIAFSLAVIGVTGILFSTQLSVSFLRGLVIAGLSLLISVLVLSYFGLLEFDLGV